MLLTLLPILLAGGGNQTPICNVAPTQIIECTGPITAVQLDGSGSFDPDGDPLQYKWTKMCVPAVFDDDEIATPMLLVDMTGLCQQECGAIRLRVRDPQGAFSICGTAVLVRDTLPPSLAVPPDALELWTTGWPTQTDPATNPSIGMAQAMDLCTADPMITFSDVVTPGVPPSGVEQVITRTWTTTDDCGNQVSDVQVITLVGPSYFSTFRLDLLPGRCPNDIRVQDGRTATISALLLGGPDADVRTIDPTSFELARTDGTIATVRPLRVRLADVRGMPSTGNCGTQGADGYQDLVLRFAMDELVEALDLDFEASAQGSDVVLRLIGRRLDGSPIECRDSLVVYLP